MRRFIGKVAAVTGGAQGIGQACALRLAQEGAAVAILDLSDTSCTLDACQETGAACVGLRVDVSSRQSLTEAVAAIAARWNDRIDIWVNNAGMFDASDDAGCMNGQAINIDGGMEFY